MGWRQASSTSARCALALSCCCGALLLLLSGCTRCERAKPFDSYVKEPTSLEAIQDLHDPPDVVVSVTEGSKESAGGGACGHSPACIILLPVIVGELAFPAHFKNATVTEHGKLTYQAVFRHNGEFVRGSVRERGVQRELQFLHLNALNRNIVVEVGQAKLDAAGKPGKLTKTSIQSQVDLLGPYARLLSDRKLKRRGAALVEVARLLGDESFSLVHERLSDASETDELKSHVLSAVCPDPKLFPAGAQRRKLMQGLAGAKPSIAVALSAAPCFALSGSAQSVPSRLPESEARRLLEASMATLCAHEKTADFLEHSAKLRPWTGGVRHAGADDEAWQRLLSTAVSGCPQDLRRAYLIKLLGGVLRPEQQALLLADKELGNSFRSLLDPNLEADYSNLLSALEDESLEPASHALSRLQQRKAPPSDRERAVLLRWYLPEHGAHTLALVLARLARVEPDAVQATQTSLEAQLVSLTSVGELASKPEPGRLSDRLSDLEVVKRSARLVLGQRDQQLQLLRYAMRYAACRDRDAGATEPRRDPSCGFEQSGIPYGPRPVDSLSQLAKYALYLTGCRSLSAEMLKRASTAKPGASGELCNEPDPSRPKAPR